MSLIEEYGERKYDKGHDEGYNEGHDDGYDKGHDEGYNEGIEESIAKCLKYGDKPKNLSEKFNTSLKEIIEIKNNILNLKIHTLIVGLYFLNITIDLKMQFLFKQYKYLSVVKS